MPGKSSAMKKIMPILGSIARRQILFLALSTVVAAIFWAIGHQVNPLTILVYSIALGNLTMLATEQIVRLCSTRRFPYNWLLFLSTLLLLLLPVYLISSLLVWWLATPGPESLRHLITTDWKFPVLITFVVSAVIYLYRTTKDRLEKRNLALQRSVDLGRVQLKMQEQELQHAREIQQSLLPKEIPQLPGYQIAGAWRPARTVSGDYFDVFPIAKNRMAICIADVVGKGVSAALLMANVQAAVHAFAGESETPAGVCVRVNRLLCEYLATGKFVTFVFGILDGENHTFEYCNAGHLDPIHLSNGKAETIDSSGAVLGVFPDWKYEDREMRLLSGDRLFLFTDGITEAEGENEQEFGEDRLAVYARENGTHTAAELNELLLGEVDRFCGSRFRDDATLLVVAAI